MSAGWKWWIRFCEAVLIITIALMLAGCGLWAVKAAWDYTQQGADTEWPYPEESSGPAKVR